MERTSIPAPPGRVRLTGIAPSTWEHPADRAALRSLRAVPGFSELVRKLVGLFGERGLRLFFQANAVRVTPQQYDWLHELHLGVLDTLDVDWEPELYVSQTPFANAGALGVDRPFVLLNSGAVNLLERNEIETVLGHEVGHILSEHALYRTVLALLLMLSTRRVPIAGIALQVVILALLEWYRKSELSADRAALLATQNPEAAMRAQMKLAGGSFHHELDLGEFLQQAEEYEQDEDLGDAVFKVMNLLGTTHPFHVLRVGEMRRWIREGNYDRVLRGEYPRRDQQTRRYRDDAREAASYYTSGLKKALRKVSQALDDAVKSGTPDL